MDAARCARRLPGVTSVHLACLESRAEMPAHSWEAAEALEEGIVFHNSLGPTSVKTDAGKVTGVAFRACTSVFDEQGRFAPRFDDSKTSSLAADTVIVTIGQGIDTAGLGVATGPGGRIVADSASLATSIPGVFAGGDAVLGPAAMVDAMAQGHKAAEAIDAYIRGTKLLRGCGPAAAPPAPTRPTTPPSPSRSPRIPGRTRPSRTASRCRRPTPAGRVGAFTEIDQGYDAEQAIAEAKRCLACGLCSECMQCVKACTAGAVLPRPAARGDRDRRRQRHPDPRLRGVPRRPAGRVRPRPLQQRAVQRAVRADALGRRTHRGSGASGPPTAER